MTVLLLEPDSNKAAAHRTVGSQQNQQASHPIQQEQSTKASQPTSPQHMLILHYHFISVLHC